MYLVKRLKEYNQKDVDKAILIIKNQLEKRLGVKLILINEKGKFRKIKTGIGFGQKYQLMNRKQYIRFNWSDKSGGKLISVDLFIKPTTNPQITIAFTNSIELLTNIVDCFKNKISIEDIKNNEVNNISIAEKEIPLETEIDMSYVGKDKKDNLYNQIVMRMNANKNGFIPSKYGKNKTFEYEGFKRINKEEFRAYAETHLDNKNVLRLWDSFYKQTAEEIKQKIDDGIYKEKDYNDYYLTYKYYFRDRTAYNKKYYDWIENYYKNKVDNIVKADKDMLDFIKYLKLDDDSLDIIRRNHIGYSKLYDLFKADYDYKLIRLLRYYFINISNLSNIVFSENEVKKLLATNSNVDFIGNYKFDINDNKLFSMLKPLIPECGLRFLNGIAVGYNKEFLATDGKFLMTNVKNEFIVENTYDKNKKIIENKELPKFAKLLDRSGVDVTLPAILKTLDLKNIEKVYFIYGFFYTIYKKGLIEKYNSDWNENYTITINAKYISKLGIEKINFVNDINAFTVTQSSKHPEIGKGITCILMPMREPNIDLSKAIDKTEKDLKQGSISTKEVKYTCDEYRVFAKKKMIACIYSSIVYGKEVRLLQGVDQEEVIRKIIQDCPEWAKKYNLSTNIRYKLFSE